MQLTSITELLDYICNTFLVSFIMCLIGSLMRELMSSINDVNNIRLKRVGVSTVFSSFLMSAASTWIKSKVPFAGYIFCCLMAGLWGYQLILVATNIKIMMVFVKNILKNISTPLGEAAKETVNEIEKTKDNNDKPTTTKSKKTTKNNTGG